MRNLTVIGLVTASLVMGSGMAMAKGKKNKDHDRGPAYEELNPRAYKYDVYSPRKKWRHKNRIANYGCVHPKKIRRRLIRQGWHNFRILRVNPRVIRAKATNFRGRRFMLRISRCDGYIISRRPVRRFWW